MIFFAAEWEKSCNNGGFWGDSILFAVFFCQENDLLRRRREKFWEIYTESYRMFFHQNIFSADFK